jgi:hypothetical protein
MNDKKLSEVLFSVLWIGLGLFFFFGGEVTTNHLALLICLVASAVWAK